MSKGFKIVTAISLIFIFAGIALLTGALIASKGDFKTISSALEKFSGYFDGANSIERTRTFRMPGTIKQIEISFINSDITIQPSSDNKVHVSYDQKKNYGYTESTKNNKLYIKEDLNWNSIFNFSFRKSNVIVQLPMETLLTDLVLTNTNGNMFIDSVSATATVLIGTNTTVSVKDSLLDAFEFNNTNGDFSATGSVFKSLKQNSTNGNFNIRNSLFDSLRSERTNGDGTIEIAEPKDNYKIDFETTTGAFSLDSQSSRGSTHLGGVSPSKSIYFKNTNGNLNINSRTSALPSQVPK